MMFKKIDIPFKLTGRKGIKRRQYGPIEYFSVLGNPFKFELLKRWKPDSVSWVEIAGGDAMAHIDHGIITALNCYFETGEASTHFWTSENPQRLTYPGEEQANIFLPQGLKHAGSFTALNGEVYLLDVSQIHSVTMAPEKTRRFIQLSWSTKRFDEVLRVIESG